ncbi:DUF305 domain-containing protein [Microbispora sp. H11081]|uniref:DUF305 domain-containing protein n=1 Tax=Microbispora sp. H11081 TaxID=2729107 RepID=UPI001B8AE414|nr:DUF305 domain-containing protein [Microbispora sp. H11081]
MRGRVLSSALLAAGLLGGTAGHGAAAFAGTAGPPAEQAVPAPAPTTPAPTTPEPTTPAATTPAAGHNEHDVMFAEMMIPHHRQAVEMSKLAPSRAADARVKRLAERIGAAQDGEIRTMSGWLTAWGKRVPDESAAPAHHAMPGMMSPEELRRLEGLSGRAFDREFLTMMIRHHEGAVTMARDELRTGVYEPARRLATSIAAGQTAEIKEMKGLLR